MIHYDIKKAALYAVLVCAFAMIFNPAQAEQDAIDILPSITHAADGGDMSGHSATHETINLTPDKSELINLEEKAGSIIIGNPAHINVIADSSHTLIVVPRMPGASHFTVLGRNGQILMQRHVIVASPKENYIRVKRICTDDAGDGCQDTSVFYCPDMCHEIATNPPQDGTSQESTDAQESDGGSDSDDLQQSDNDVE